MAFVASCRISTCSVLAVMNSDYSSCSPSFRGKGGNLLFLQELTLLSTYLSSKPRPFVHSLVFYSPRRPFSRRRVASWGSNGVRFVEGAWSACIVQLLYASSGRSATKLCNASGGDFGSFG
ncbi:hypothetical protein Salat_0930900 [Sesamum alatum]|uniref:Uncharacterized protein n=1 Tax=Sesamum alatum TaxID=300844 RepID=A0AAE2CRD6_9LAMI|nr:hypothetical protein Salat_0930900 [Sesamum alatum]